MIDVATLTGACVIALGHHITGLMANHNPLAHELIAASEQSGDRAWRLPLGDEYQEQLESNFCRYGEHWRSSLVGRLPQVASCRALPVSTTGRTWISPEPPGVLVKAKGATGRPVALLAQFLLNRAGFNGEE